MQTIAILVICRIVVGHKYPTSQLLTTGELKKFHRTPYVREFRGFEDTGLTLVINKCTIKYKNM